MRVQGLLQEFAVLRNLLGVVLQLEVVKSMFIGSSPQLIAKIELVSCYLLKQLAVEVYLESS
jgi:hypothetical protein